VNGVGAEGVEPGQPAGDAGGALHEPWFWGQFRRGPGVFGVGPGEAVGGGHGAAGDIGGQEAGPVEQGVVAGGLVPVEQELPDSGGAAAAREVVPVSGVEPGGQAAVPQGLQAGVDGVLSSRLRVDLVQQQEQPHGAGRTVAPAVGHRQTARSWWYRERHRPAAGMVPDSEQSACAAGGDVH
jgi:hypothetical protein